MVGALSGIRIIEMAGIGPAPFRGMMLADQGAEVILVHHPGRAIEPQFYAEPRRLAGLDGPEFDDQMNPAVWEPLKVQLADLFRSRTRDHWCALLDPSDACFAPVLSMAEAPLHPHNVARQTFIDLCGVTQPGPAPRFSRTPAAAPRVAETLQD